MRAYSLRRTAGLRLFELSCLVVCGVFSSPVTKASYNQALPRELRFVFMLTEDWLGDGFLNVRDRLGFDKIFGAHTWLLDLLGVLLKENFEY